PRIRVEDLAGWLVEHLAVILAAAALGNHLDVSAAHAAGFRAQTAGFNLHFFGGPDAGWNRVVEHRAAALKSIRGIVDTVERDVHRAARHVVVMGVLAADVAI